MSRCPEPLPSLRQPGVPPAAHQQHIQQQSSLRKVSTKSISICANIYSLQAVFGGLPAVQALMPATVRSTAAQVQQWYRRQMPEREGRPEGPGQYFCLPVNTAWHLLNQLFTRSNPASRCSAHGAARQGASAQKCNSMGPGCSASRRGRHRSMINSLVPVPHGCENMHGQPGDHPAHLPMPAAGDLGSAAAKLADSAWAPHGHLCFTLCGILCCSTIFCTSSPHLSACHPPLLRGFRQVPLRLDRPLSLPLPQSCPSPPGRCLQLIVARAGPTAPLASRSAQTSCSGRGSPCWTTI